MKEEKVKKKFFKFKVDQVQKEFIEKLVDDLLIKYPFLNRDLAIYKMIIEYAYTLEDRSINISLGKSKSDVIKLCSSCERKTSCNNLDKWK